MRTIQWAMQPRFDAADASAELIARDELWLLGTKPAVALRNGLQPAVADDPPSESQLLTKRMLRYTPY